MKNYFTLFVLCFGFWILVFSRITRADTLYLYDLKQFKESFGKEISPGESIVAKFSDCKSMDSKKSSQVKVKCQLEKDKSDLILIINAGELKDIIEKPGIQELKCNFVKFENNSAVCSKVEDKIAADSNKSKEDNKLWAHEQKAVAQYNERAKQNAPYWLREIEFESNFKQRSQEMIQKISRIAGTDESPFCIAVFVSAVSTGKDASLYCIKSISHNGYDSNCSILQANLGTGEIYKNDHIIGAKCNSDAASLLLRMSPANLLMESDLYNGGFNGDLGIYIYRDHYQTIKRWLSSKGEINKPRAKEKSKSKPKHIINAAYERDCRNQCEQLSREGNLAPGLSILECTKKICEGK